MNQSNVGNERTSITSACDCLQNSYQSNRTESGETRESRCKDPRTERPRDFPHRAHRSAELARTELVFSRGMRALIHRTQPHRSSAHCSIRSSQQHILLQWTARNTNCTSAGAKQSQARESNAASGAEHHLPRWTEYTGPLFCPHRVRTSSRLFLRQSIAQNVHGGELPGSPDEDGEFPPAYDRDRLPASGPPVSALPRAEPFRRWKKRSSKADGVWRAR